MLGAEAGPVSEPKKKKVIGLKSVSVLSEAQTEESIAEYIPNRQHCSNGGNKNFQEDKGDETYEESDEDPEVVMDEEPEEDPEEEIYEESDEDPEDITDEDPEEDPEAEEIDGESEEDPKTEEIDGESEEDPEEEEIDGETEEDPEADDIDGETEEDPDEEIVENPEEEPEEEINEQSDKEELLVENSHLSSTTNGGIDSLDFRNELNEDPEEERGKKLVEASGSEPISKSAAPAMSCNNNKTRPVEDQNQYHLEPEPDITSKQQEQGGSSGKQRHSRWDLKQERETPEMDGNSKRRKTRWDNNDTQNGSLNSSDIINLVGLSMDPEIVKLKVKLMEINKKLINTSDAEIQETLMNKSKRIISKLANANLKPTKFVKKLFVPVKEYPTYNFIGLILGPKGSTQKKMEKETGAKIFIRGKGSGEAGPSEDEDLHVLVEACNQRALEAAASMIEKLLIPVADENNDHKRTQLVELAKLKGKYKDPNICNLCKEQGHRHYACPLQDSTFTAICCDICGSFGHATSNCCATQGYSALVVDHANLYVGYLPHAIDEQRLRELFLPFGKIIKTTVIRDQTTGLSKGYGFIKFENPSDSAAAVTYMNGYKMDGKMLAVRVAGKKPVPGPLSSAHVPIHSLQTAVPPNILGHTSSIYGQAVSMLPEAPFSSAKNENLFFPSSSSYPGPDNLIARNEAMNIPPYTVSSTADPRVTSNFSSGYDFGVQIPSSLSNSQSQFPGDPDYQGSQFKSYFTNPSMDETPSQMPETDKKSIFWFASSFP